MSAGHTREKVPAESVCSPGCSCLVNTWTFWFCEPSEALFHSRHFKSNSSSPHLLLNANRVRVLFRKKTISCFERSSEEKAHRQSEAVVGFSNEERMLTGSSRHRHRQSREPGPLGARQGMVPRLSSLGSQPEGLWLFWLSM